MFQRNAYLVAWLVLFPAIGFAAHYWRPSIAETVLLLNGAYAIVGFCYGRWCATTNDGYFNWGVLAMACAAILIAMAFPS